MQFDNETQKKNVAYKMYYPRIKETIEHDSDIF